MYSSREIRWFFREEQVSIGKWFAGRNQSFSSVKPRSDFYLPLPGRDDLNIKLREGRIELKQRVSAPVRHKLTRSATGFMEHWVKWSFKLSEDDAQSGSIIHDGKSPWKEVHKERMGFKMVMGRDGEILFRDILEMVPAACQVEYARLLVGGNRWYSFGLEWFGEPIVNVVQRILEEILGDSTLDVGESLSYAAFLDTLDAGNAPATGHH